MCVVMTKNLLLTNQFLPQEITHDGMPALEPEVAKKNARTTNTRAYYYVSTY